MKVLVGVLLGLALMVGVADAAPIEVASLSQLAKVQDQQNHAFLRRTHERKVQSACHRTKDRWACRQVASQNGRTYEVVKHDGVVKAVHGRYYDR